MRNLVSFAVACLILVPAAGVRAEVFPGGDEDDPGGKVGGDGPERGVVEPMVTIDTMHVSNELDAKFEIHIEFDQDVTGLELDEIGVTNAITVSDLMGQDQNYYFEIRTNTDFVGSIAITVPAGAAENTGGEGNVAMTLTFAVDNKAPELERATASRDTITLVYDETLDEDHEPDRSQFTVMAWDADGNVKNDPQLRDEPRVRGDRVFVLLQVQDSILAGDSVEIDYTPTNNNPLQDARGNTAPQLMDKIVTNLRTLDVPGAVQNLKATGVNTDTIEIEWDPPADDGGSDIIGYRIQASNDGGTTYSVLRSSTGEPEDTVSAFVHDGLEPDETWHYLVSAINDVGEGTITGTSGTTKREGEAPGPPTELNAEPDGTTAIDLDWDAPADIGSSAITGYRIEVSSDGNAPWTDLVTTTNTNTFYKHTGLQPNTLRHYRVWAKNSTGESDDHSNVANATTKVVVVTSPPGAPTGLTATAQGTDQIDLFWTAPADDGNSAISGYKIEYSDDAGANWDDLVEDTDNTSTTYADTGLDPATTRHYRVSAINAVGTGPVSDPASNTTDGDVPGRPTGLTATAQGADQIDLAWTAPSDDGGSAITDYRIEVSSNAGATWTDLVANTGSTTTTYPHTGLNQGETRHYQVSAINGVGAGSPSGVANATTFDAPGRPRNLTATPNGQTRIDLSWDAPTSNGGSSITGYRIDISSNGGATWTVHVANSNSSATAYMHENLTAGTIWHYRVFAINAIGTSSASNVAYNTTAATVPDAPTNLTATASGRTRIDLEWDKPSFTGGQGIDITGYRIQKSDDAGANWDDLVANTGRTTTRYANTGLSAGTTRHYRVRAINAVGAGDPSNVDDATTAPNVPGPPQGLSAAAVSMTQIDLSWSPPASDSGSAITGYRIEVSNTGNSGWSVLEAHTNSSTTEYSHTGLTPDTTLHYRVRAINGVGPGAASIVDRATTDPRVPDAPTNLTATAGGQSRINLTWSPPGYDGGSRVTGYRIEVSSNGGTTWTILAANTNSVVTSYAHSGLTPGSTRHYQVKAINGVGRGDPSNVAHATTDVAAPASPTDLEAMADGPFQIDLTWVAPTDDGGSPVTGYRIEFSRTGNSGWSVLELNTNSSDTEYSHTDLTAGTRNFYRVRAINEEGPSAPSNVAQATTTTVPASPTDLNAMADGPFQIDLSWVAPTDDGGSPVTGYRIEVSSNGGSSWTVLAGNTNSVATSYMDGGLAPGTTRHYRVRAINVAGTGPSSDVAHATTDATAPASPTDLEAMADGPFKIDLTWAAPTDDGGSPVTGYRIEVSTTRGATWTTLEENTGSTATAGSQVDLPPATRRDYRVSALNAVGASFPSNVAHATTDAVVPASPTDLEAMADGPFRIALSWAAPTYDGGSPVTGYRIEVSTTRGVTWRTLEENTGSASTAYSHMGLLAATRRDYRVSAINAAGRSLPSNVADATTDPDLPDAPTDLQAMARGTSQIELEWMAPSYTGGVAISGYRIEVSEDGGSRWDELEANVPSTPTRYTHMDLDPATTRHYRVSATNAAGTGDASNVASATTDATTPDAPTDLAATADGTSRIDLAWTAPDYDGGAGVTGYRIEVSGNGGVTWTDLEANTQSTSTTYAHTGLSPATTRHYRVSAINRIGAGDPSEPAHETTDATVPDAPQRLTAAAHDHERIDLGWGSPDFNGGSAITGYRIEVSENEGSTWADLVANTGSTETEYSHTGLDPATTRHYRVSAINAIGTGAASDVANATTDAVVPGRPTNLVATATEPTRIDLNWSAPAYDGGAPIRSYRIEVSEDGINWTDLQRSTGTTLTSYAHIGLKPGSTRHYRVSAINVAGTGLPSNTASASTDDPVERAGRVNEAILPHFAAAATTSTMAAISGRIEAVASRNPLQSQLGAAGLLSRAGNMGLRGSAGGLNMARLFDGKSFALPLGGDGQQEDISTPVGFTTWGSAEYTSMGEPDGEGVEWDGDMLSIHIGADARVHRDILAGIAGSRSAGNYDFTDVTGEREVEGTYEARMTSLNPYLAWLPGRKGVAVWAAGSFGWGEVTIDDEPGGQRASDTRSRAGAVGGSRIMHSSGASALRLRAEGWMSQVEVDGSEGMDTLTLDMQRLRLALEWSQVQRLTGGQEVNFVMEGGLRYGDGDGTEGAGMELGGGLRFVSATRALTVEGHGRVLATSPEDYEEWGFRGLIQIEPQAAVNHGLLVKITPAWGQSASGVQELYEQGAGNRPDMGDALQRGRVNTRVEYGLGEFSGTPYGRFYLADGGARAFGTGMRYSVTRVLDLRFEGTRTESASGPVRHGLAMRGRWVF